MIPFPLKELLVRNSSLSSVRLFFGGGGRYDRKTWQCLAVESTGGRYEVATEYNLGSKSDDGIQEGLVPGRGVCE